MTRLCIFTSSTVMVALIHLVTRLVFWISMKTTKLMKGRSGQVFSVISVTARLRCQVYWLTQINYSIPTSLKCLAIGQNPSVVPGHLVVDVWPSYILIIQIFKISQLCGLTLKTSYSSRITSKQVAASACSVHHEIACVIHG